jgi:radical SAM protein with 4Fe4S-binding SPASM domain
LLFTGGETLLRSDFPEIYAHACQKGILVTVFTNGTLLSEQVIQVFETYPPHCVEITLYGATAATYEKITGVPGSFEKCLKAISRLIKGGFHLKLKTMLLTINSHELEAMKAFASDLKASFRYDAAISACLDGNEKPLQYRVPIEMIIEKESADRKKIKQWYDFYQRLSQVKPSGNLYECGAGITLFHVDSSGILRPCMMVPCAKYDLTQNHFHDIWYEKDFMSFQKPGEMPLACKSCDNRVLCGYCPGFFKLETGDEKIPSDFLCTIGEQRKKIMFEFISKEKKQ